jgi:hypothetical protein
MRCEQLSKDERQYFWAMRAMQRTVAEAQTELYKMFPDAFCYEFETLKRWAASKEGKEEYEIAVSAERRSARKKSYANKDSRLLSLIEIGEKVFEDLKDMSPKKNQREFVSLSKEFREILAAIANEVDPFNMGDTEIRSSAQAFLEQVKEADVPEWMLGTVFEKPQTQAT